MTWKNAPKTAPKDKVGFVYEITELDTGLKYIGIKKFWKIEKKKPTKYLMKAGKYVKDKKGKRILNTRKNKICTKKESNWRDYNSSNPILSEKIPKNPSNYKKTILRICSSITELKLHEAYIQLDYYISGNWDMLYNEVINLRLRARK